MAHRATWALVTDGVRARIVRDLESGSVTPRPELISKSRSVHLRALLTDPAELLPIADGGETRSGADKSTDAILADMRDFTRATLEQLREQLQAGAFQRLGIFAPPGMTKILSEEMPEELEKAIVLEEARDLMRLSEGDLRKTVSAVLSERPRD